jgi:glycosyltransferase involved in cell wall biosynthesis
MTDCSQAPLISVLMSVHNGRHYLAEAVDSILAQTMRDFEFIIIDDGSSDGSTEDLRSYAARDPRIRLSVQENSGLTKALNVGLKLSRGEFVARMDADDIAHSERLAKQVAAFRSNPKLAVLGTRVELISSDGVQLGARGTKQGHRNIRRRLLIGDGAVIVHPVVMFRRQTALDVGGYDERFATGQDLDLFLRLSEVGLVDNLSDMLLYWRQHKNSVNRTRSSTWRAVKMLAIEKTLERIGAKQFAEELFVAEPEFRFPQDQFDLGRFALNNGRYREAGKLFWEELVKGRRRRESLEQLFLVAIAFLYHRLKRSSFQAKSSG